MDGLMSPDPGGRSPRPSERVDELCDRFEAAWQAGKAPRIEDYLSEAEAGDRSVLLGELVGLERELRRRRGERPLAHEYLDRFPAQAAIVRAAFGTQPDPGDGQVARRQNETGRNLLFGVLALQNNFISRDDLLAVFAAWVADKSRPLAQLLVHRGALDEARRALLDALVAEHLKQHGGDTEASLAAVSSLCSVRDDLERLDDADLQASLVAAASQAAEPGADADATTTNTSSSSRRAGDRFRIIRFHREGGLGRVYVASDEELGRQVALKEIRPDKIAESHLRNRFVLEAEINGGLEHPGIVPVYSLGTYDDGRPFYAMRFVEGDSLKEAIALYHEECPRPDPTAVEFRKLLGRFIDVCEAIAFAHSKGVLHRDLKPHNVMLGRFGETLLIDWGLAKATGRREPIGPDSAHEKTLVPPSGSGHDPTLGVLGSPPYMSPEQARGEVESLGPATDVYGLGAILFALLTGEPPVEGKTTEEVLDHVRHGAIRSPRALNPKVSRALEAVCLKALAARTGDRYPTAMALAEEVEHWLADEPVTAWREPFSIRMRRWMRRHPFSIGAAATGSLLVAVSLSVIAVLQNTANRNLRIAREQADQQAELAVQAVDDFRNAVEANVDVKNNPELDSLRKTLLRTPLEFYRRLRDDLEKTTWDRPKVRSRLASSYVQLARLTEEIGSQVDAIQAYRQAIDILTGLLHDAPRDRTIREDLGSSLLRIGSLYSRQGQPRAAMEAFVKSLDLASLAIKQSSAPTPVALYRNLAECHLAIAREHSDHGRPRDSMDSYRKAFEILESAARAEPSDPELGRSLASCHLEIAGDDGRHGRPTPALAHFQAALKIAVQLTHEHPDEVRYQALLASTHSDLAGLHISQGRPAEELASKKKAMEIFQRIARDHPTNSAYQEFLGLASGNLANYRLSHGQVEENRASVSKELDEHVKLVERNPGNTLFQRSLAGARIRLAHQQIHDGHPSAALASCRQSVDLLEQLAHAHPTDVTIQRDLAWALQNLGNLLKRAGRFEAALTSYQAVIQLERRLAEIDPENVQYQRYLALAHQAIGLVHYSLGKFSEADASFQATLQTLGRIAALDPTNAEIQALRADTSTHLANLRDDSGKPEDAAPCYRDSIKILEGLVHEDPTAVYKQHSLAQVYRDFGLCRRRQGETADALALFEKALAVIRKLAQQQPANLGYREDLAKTYNSIGEVRRRLKNWTGAAESFRHALDVRKALAGEDPDYFDNLYGLGAVNSNLGWNSEEQGDHEAALNWLEQAVRALQVANQKQPGHEITRALLLETYQNRSQVLASLGRYADALSDIEQASRFDTGAARAAIRLSRGVILVQSGRHKEGVAEAAAVASNHPASGYLLYNSACVYSRASAQVGRDLRLTDNERQAHADAYASRAITLLEGAFRLGFFRSLETRQGVEKDPDLEPLRSRADFRSLRDDVRFPANVFAP